MKAIVTKKVYDEERGMNHYYFRNLYGLTWEEMKLLDDYEGYKKISYNIPGTDLYTEADYEIGDFVEYERENEETYKIRKFVPTEQDLKTRDMFEKYLAEASKNFGLFFREVLEYGRETIEDECETIFAPYKYTDEEIDELVNDLVDSISTFGVKKGQAGGLASFWIFLDMQNAFKKEPVDYLEKLGYLGYPDCYPYNRIPYPEREKYMRKMTVPRKYSTWLDYNGAYLTGYISGFDMGCPGYYFVVSLDEDLELKVEPYKPGMFKEAMADLNSEKHL